jgi:hypothetical protein
MVSELIANVNGTPAEAAKARRSWAVSTHRSAVLQPVTKPNVTNAASHQGTGQGHTAVSTTSAITIAKAAVIPSIQRFLVEPCDGVSIEL